MLNQVKSLPINLNMLPSLSLPSPLPKNELIRVVVSPERPSASRLLSSFSLLNALIMIGASALRRNNFV